MNPRSIGSLLLFGMLGCSGGSTDPPAPIQGIPPRWGNQARVPSSSTLRAILMANQDQYFVSGDATSIFRSNDGGATWQQQEHQPFANGGDILSMDGLFLDLVHVGNNGDPVTPTGRGWGSANGVNWTAVETTPTPGEPFLAVDLVQPTIFNAPNKAFFLRSDGMVRRREGSGGIEVASGHPAPRDLDAVSSGMVVVVGDANGIRASGSYGDAGTWVDLVYTGAPTSQDLHGVHVLSQALMFACGTSGRIYFTDSGDDLVELPTATAQTLRSIYFPLTPAAGWAVGDNGTILKITGTQNPMTLVWSFGVVAQTSLTTDDLYEVRFVDNSIGLAVGENGTIRKTINGGTTWSDPVTGTQGVLETLNAIDFVPAGDRGLAVGANGTVLRTLNGGVSWAAFDAGISNTQTLRSVSIKRLAPNEGAVICGDGGFVRYNTDVWGVGAWQTPATAPPVQDYYGVVWWGTTAAIMVGNASTITQTTDLANWSASVYAATATNFRSLCVTSDLLAFAGGSGGVLAESDLLAPGWLEIVEAPAIGAVTVLSIDAPAGGSILYLACDDDLFRRVNLPLGAAVLQAGGAVPGVTATNAVAVNGVGNLFLAGNKMWLSTDGGMNWTTSFTHTYRTMNAVWRRGPSGEQGYAAGAGGTVLRTDVGGD